MPAVTMNSPMLIRSQKSLKKRLVGKHRRGKVLVLLAILLPSLCGMIGMVMDTGFLLSEHRQVQHATDAAATAAAMEKQHDSSASKVLDVAMETVQVHNEIAGAMVEVNSPPTSGPYAGSNRHVEVVVSYEVPTFFMHIVGGAEVNNITCRAVAGFEPATDGAAIVVLDPRPDNFSLGALTPLLPPLPALLGGVEVLGLGSVEVHGAVLVNNEWGGEDEYGLPAGVNVPLKKAVTCTPIVGLTKFRTEDMRIVGGVSNYKHFGTLDPSASTPFKANRLPVPDPLKDLQPPTISLDPTNVSATMRGGRTIIGIPIIGPKITLYPGVYEWIDVVSGRVEFRPGVYIIRGKSPITQIPLKVLAGQVEANGVMFYITDNSGYDPSGSTFPDSSDGENDPPHQDLGNLLPSALINIGLLGSDFHPLNDPASPYHDMLIFQRRHDRRPIVLVQEALLGNGQFGGTTYTKWGHVLLAGIGDYDARFVCGTMRMLAILDMDIRPSTLLPPAEDVFLVE